MHSVTPGYTGGTSRFVTYYTLGDHKEAIQIDFDPSVLSFDRLLGAFWSHNRPGAAAKKRIERTLPVRIQTNEPYYLPNVPWVQ